MMTLVYYVASAIARRIPLGLAGRLDGVHW